MTPFRWSSLVLPCLLGLAVVLAWHLREVMNASEELSSELGSAQNRLGDVGRERDLAQREVLRLRTLRDLLETDVKRLEERVERQTLMEEIPVVLERVRGYGLRRPLKVRWVDRAFTKKFVQGELARQLPKGYAEAYSRTLARVGLLPGGYELERAALNLMTEQAAGFYDPRSQILYVNDGMPAAELVLSHELAHALADQRFDLQKMLATSPLDQDDRAFALRALVEGDATFAMQRYFAQSLSLWKLFELVGDVAALTGMDQAELQAAPMYVREPLVRAYLDGMKFVTALHQVGGNARVDRAFAEPPVSSAQILHPQKYLRGEKPTELMLPDATPILGAGWRILHENTFGELGFATLFQSVPTAQPLAKAAAEGWGGDRLRAYAAEGGRLVVLWRSTWDTPQDRAEYLTAHGLVLEQRYGPRNGPAVVPPTVPPTVLPTVPPSALTSGAQQVPREASALRWKTPHGVILLAGRDRDAVLVEGAVDDAQADRLAALLSVPVISSAP